MAFIPLSLQAEQTFSQNTPSDAPFFALTDLEKRDFIQALRSLFVFGDRKMGSTGTSIFSGLRLTQEDRLNRLLELLEDTEADENSANQTLLSEAALYIFSLDQATIDWSQEFRRVVGADPMKVSDFYSNVLKQLPDSVPKTFEQVMRRLCFEIDQKFFVVRFPVLNEFVLFPGLRGYEFDQFVAFGPAVLKSLPAEILNKIKNDLRLSFEEYRTIFETLRGKSLSNENAVIAYTHYLAVGTLPFAEMTRPLSRDIFMEHLNAASEAGRQIAVETKTTIDDDRLMFSAEKKEFYWHIYNASRIQAWRPDWDKSWRDSQAQSLSILGALWVQNQFSDRWPALAQDDSETKLPEESGFGRLQREIDEMVSEILSSDEHYLFEATIAQVEDDSWNKKGIEGFAYYRLSEELKNLAVGRLFPDLTVAQGRALLEKQFTSLSETERMEVANHIYTDMTEMLRYIDLRKNLSDGDPKQNDRFHEVLVKNYFEARALPKAHADDFIRPDTITLLDGSKIPSSTVSKERMEAYLNENPNAFEGSWTPDWLVRWLSINLFPYPGYLEDEIFVRTINEWNRRSEVRAYRDNLSRLQKEYDTSRTDEDKKSIVARIESEIKRFNEQFAAPHDSSPAISATAFLSGVTPQSFKDMGSAAVAATAGAAFYIVLQVTGISGKAAFWLIAGDTCLRFGTAYKLSEEGGFDLEKGYSSYLGKWTAHTLATSWDIARTIYMTEDAETRLDAYDSAGQMAGEFLWFGAGSYTAARILHLGRVTKLRKIDHLQKEIERVRGIISEHRLKISNLKNEIAVDQKFLDSTRKAFGDAAPEVAALHQQLVQKQMRLNTLETGTIPGYDNLIQFLSKQMLSQLARLGKFFYINPLTKFFQDPARIATAEKLVWYKRLVRRFNRRGALGISQYEQYISRLHGKIQIIQEKGFAAESSVSLKRYKNNQATASRELAEAELLLRGAQTPGLSPKKSTQLTELSLKAFQRGFEAFREHIVDLQSLQKTARTPPTWSATQKLLFEVEHAKEFLNPWRYFQDYALRPLEIPAADAMTQRFFTENYLRLRAQLRMLRDMHSRLAIEIKSGRLPATDATLSSMRLLEVNLSAQESVILTLTPNF